MNRLAVRRQLARDGWLHTLLMVMPVLVLGRAPALRTPAAQTHRLSNQHKLVPRNHRLAKLHVIHGQQNSQFTGILQLLCKQQTG